MTAAGARDIPTIAGARWGAVVVAGGHGRRAGGPKALRATPSGRPLWRVRAEELRDCGAAVVVAVLHPAAMAGAAMAGAAMGAPGLPWLAIEVADPDAAMFASLQQGLRRALGHTAGPLAGVFVLPVDAAAPTPAWLQALAAATTAAPGWQVARPTAVVDGHLRAGHPVLIAATAAAGVVGVTSPEARLDAWISELPPSARVDVLIADGEILRNDNGPGDGG